MFPDDPVGEEPIVVGAVRYLDYAGEETKDRSMLAVFFHKRAEFRTRPKPGQCCRYESPPSSLCRSPMTEWFSRSTQRRWCNKYGVAYRQQLRPDCAPNRNGGRRRPLPRPGIDAGTPTRVLDGTRSGFP